MLSAKDVHELFSLREESPEVISLYLGLGEGRDPLRRCRELIQKAGSGLPRMQGLDPEFRKIEEFIENLEPRPHGGLALFSARERRLWIAAALPQWVPDFLGVAATPALAPLANLLDQHHRYGVALVSPGEARLVEIFLGQAEERPISPEAPGREPRAADPAERRLTALANEIVDAARRREWDLLVLGASPDLEPRLLRHLHTRLQDTLILDPQLNARTPLPEVLERVRGAESDSRAVRESVLVYRLLDAVKAGGMGVVGLRGTLFALNRGEVRMLLVREGLAKMGRVCRHCGALSLDGKKCHYCWLDTQPSLNLAGDMVSAALERGCEVFLLLHDRRLDPFGGVGAELCFKSPSGSSKSAEEPRPGSRLAGASPGPPGE